MRVRAVLDAAAFDFMNESRGRGMRDLLRSVVADGGQVVCAAVTLAEVCRGVARTRRAEAVLARQHGGQRVRVMHTDERFAKQVGAILHDSGSGSERIADAHVVAACATADLAIVVTSDPDDIMQLGEALPGTRMLTRHPTGPSLD